MWQSIMFKNPTRPKAIFILWIFMYRKLATKDRLAKWGIIQETACVLCATEDESLDNMFLHCHYVSEVWKRVITWAGFNSNRAGTWTQFMQWSIQQGKGKSTRAQLFKMLLAEMVYVFWNERNKRILKTRRL